MTKFDAFDLRSELLDALSEMNFIEPTEVQEKAIPLALEGRDLIVRSKTGTGKTGAFLIPILQNATGEKGIQSIIVVPTRELAMQVLKVAEQMSKHLNTRPVVVYGGASIENQIRNLRKGTSMVIGTPGRLIDLMERGEINLSKIRYLVLDEADIMLDLGFIEDIEFIISKAPEKKQSMLFSATVPERIVGLTKRFMKKPEFLKIGQEKEVTVDTIFHMYTFSNGASKVPALLAYLKEYQPGKSIIFSETKRGTDALYNMLVSQGYEAVVIHGDLTQAQREKSLMEFRKGAQFLVATNVAARGLDIDDVSDIINFDAPSEPEIYVHRVGRSARMGKSGTALTIIDSEEFGSIKDIEKKLRIRMSRIELDQDPFIDMKLSFSYNRNGRSNGGRSQGFRGSRSGGSRNGPPRQGEGRFRYPRNGRPNRNRDF